jgi:hypothetical protein
LDSVEFPESTFAPNRTRVGSRWQSALIWDIARIAGRPKQVEVIARVNSDQYLVLRLPLEEMENRGLVVGTWVKLDARERRVSLV